MKYKNLYSIILGILLLCCAGCAQRYVCWLAADVFYQGEKLELCIEAARQYLRSAHVYDQLTTLGIFEVLWLHDVVRTVYAQLYAHKNGLDKSRYYAFLRRQKEENKHFISFIVLGTIPGTQDPIFLTKNAMWSAQLKVGGHYFAPLEIKIIELNPEYRLIFGKNWTRFKNPYLISFNAFDVDGNAIITPGVDHIELILRRVGRKGKRLIWTLDMQGNIVPRSLAHPNVLAYDLDDNI